jgi:hypothetical protein
MINQQEWRWVAGRAALLVILVTLPYVIAYLTTPPDLFYTGFLSNPEDGNTYLAKMQQGLRGQWRTHLSYTAEPHNAEFIFTYYVLLGHLARWTGLSPIVVFHLTRILNGFLLLMVLYYAVSCFFGDQQQRRFAFTITAVGSGLGWLASLAGRLTADMWVPEGYILYSIFVNPHFPLAIALMVLSILWSITPWGARRPDGWRLAGLTMAVAALGIVQPFCLLTVGLLLSVYAAALWIQKHRPPWRELVSVGVVGAVGSPLVLNVYRVSTQNPVFAIWAAQNQTPSPPLWDYAISYGLVLVLAIVGFWAAIRRRRNSDWLTVLWTVSSVALLYIPFSLQRRLLMGLIVPLGMLATMGWHTLSSRRHFRVRLFLALSSLTHLFLLVVALTGALTRHESLFMTRDERAALAWLGEHAAPDAVVIASPQTGLYIPAWAGQRVVYGHRFETPHAEQRRQQLLDFFQRGDQMLLSDSSLQPSLVFFGPRERALAPDDWRPEPTWRPVYQQGGVTIYALPQ